MIPERLLRSELLVPFQAAISEAGAYTVMPSYNEVDGVPSHVNGWLLEDVLRREWGFRGLVVSDYFAVEQLISQHHVAADKADAARQALAAGVDMELPDPDAYPVARRDGQGRPRDGSGRRSLGAARAAREVPRRPVRAPVRRRRCRGVAQRTPPRTRPLRWKRRASRSSCSRTTTARCRSIATGSRRWPSSGRTRRAFTSAATRAKPEHTVDILSGISKAAGPGVRVLHAEGVRITEHDADWNADKVVLGDPEKNRARIKEAVAIARQADTIVLVIGTNESTSREAWSDSHLGDVADLSLVSQQGELVTAMLQTGKPVVVVLSNGRPLAIPDVAARVPAIIETWYAGQEGGTAIGAVLFGDVNPGGKLPVSFPRQSGQLPVYYNRRPTSFRAALDLSRDPLWPFGFGLSYTTFKLANLKLEQPSIGPGGKTKVTVEVTQQRRPRRRRGRAALRPRRREFGDPSDQGTAWIRARHVVAGRKQDRHLRARPGGTLADRSPHAARRRTRKVRGDGGHQLEDATDRDPGRRLAMKICSGRVIVCSPGRNFVTLKLETERRRRTVLATRR